jgi:Replication-relaxation
MERNRRAWYEREEIDRITLDWVKLNCRLTTREIELLEIINERKLVRRDHLEVISPSYRELGSNRTEILNRSIRKLFRTMCLDKIHEKRDIGIGGNNPCTVALDRAGSIILGINHKRRIIHKKEGKYIRRSLPVNYRHINGVNQLEVDTIEVTDAFDGQITAWHHEKPQKLQYGVENISVIPDVRLELKFNGKPFYAFLEYDTGSEDRRNKNNFPTIRDKLLKYKKYKSSKLWDSPYFPLILFVSEDMSRLDYVNRVMKEFGLEGWGIYRENYRDVLERISKFV